MHKRKTFKERYRESRNLQIVVIVFGAILFYLVLSNLGVVRDAFAYLLGIVSPILIAAILAILIHPAVMFIERKAFGKIKWKSRKYIHGFCVIFVAVVLCILAILLLYLVINQLAVSVAHLVSHFDIYVSHFSATLKDWTHAVLGEDANELTLFGINLLEVEASGLQEFASSILEWTTQHMDGIIGGALSVGTNLMNVLMTVMLTIYMLLDAKHLKISTIKFFRSTMHIDRYERFSTIASKSIKIFTRYFGSNILDAVIIGVLCYLFMIIMGYEYALLIAVIVGVCNLVPTFGPIVGAILSGFLLLLVDPWSALWFIVYSIVSQFIDANLIKPKLFGNTTGLRPMWVLAAIIIGGGLFGVVGMLMGVPVFAIVAIIEEERVENRLKRRKLEEEEEQETEEASGSPEGQKNSSEEEVCPEEHAEDSAAEELPADDKDQADGSSGGQAAE